MTRAHLRPLAALVTVGLAALGMAACQPTDTVEEAGSAVEAEPDAESVKTVPAPMVFEVEATEHSFTAPPKISSGWNNVVLHNQGEEPHFLNLWKLPEGKAFGDYTSEVIDPFLAVVRRYRAGELDHAEMMVDLGKVLPKWYDGVAMGMGGAGITSPGHAVSTWVRLEPGEYVMECYAQSPDGRYHWELGMLRPLIVTEEGSGLEPPGADVAITLSNYAITLDGEFVAGEQTIAVTVAENPEGRLGHDLHLARLEEDAKADAIADWLDLTNPAAIRSPAPAEFLGGTEQVPEGHTTYLTVTLEPGRYLWISEGYAKQGVVKEFTVD